MPTQGEHVASGLPEEIRKDRGLAITFRIEQVLGTGGMAVVAAAHHLELDQRVALKFLLPEAITSKAAVARFRKEARAAAKIKSEHVVRILDVRTTEAGVPYIVMEYLEGSDLEQRLQNAVDGRLPIPDAIDFVLQASEAIAEGHRLGIVHRDLKPANLFCAVGEGDHPMIKVLDFGISKITATIGEVERTDRYEILGSPRYMSPEQIDSARDVDRRSDIWSLGVVLYRSLTGQLPFSEELIPELWRKIHSHTPRPPGQLRASVPAILDQIVMRCLEKEPARRFSDLGELATALACVAPARSRGSIERIVRTSGSAYGPSSLSPLMTEKTLATRYFPRGFARWYRSRAAVGSAIGLTMIGGLALAGALTGRIKAPGLADSLGSAVPLANVTLAASPEGRDGPEDALLLGREVPPISADAVLPLPNPAGSGAAPLPGAASREPLAPGWRSLSRAVGQPVPSYSGPTVKVRPVEAAVPAPLASFPDPGPSATAGAFASVGTVSSSSVDPSPKASAEPRIRWLMPPVQKRRKAQ